MHRVSCAVSSFVYLVYCSDNYITDTHMTGLSFYSHINIYSLLLGEILFFTI